MTVVSLESQQVDVTVVHAVLPGFHVGSTLKHLRGHAQGPCDLDVGAIAVVGRARFGGVAGTLRRAEFTVREAGCLAALEQLGEMPVTVAVDADRATEVAGQCGKSVRAKWGPRGPRDMLTFQGV